MFELIVRRFVSAVPLLFLVSVFAFALIKAVPGDPVDVLLGTSEKDLPPAQVAALRHEMGLDQPLPKQYVAWLSGWWGQGELGRSYRDGRPVAEVIAERCPATIALVGTALVLSAIFGISLGLLMAAVSDETGGPWSQALIVLSLLLYSTPGFWLAFLVIFAVGIWLPWIPVVGLHSPGQPVTFAGAAAHLILPALLLSLRRAAKIALFLRALILDEMTRDYVLIARSKGLSRGAVLVRHVLRNSLMPVVALLGLSLPALLGGSVLIETVFGWPGMGRLAVEATFGRNYPLLLSRVGVYGGLVVIAKWVGDVVVRVGDPRLRDSAEDTTWSGPAAPSRMVP